MEDAKEVQSSSEDHNPFKAFMKSRESAQGHIPEQEQKPSENPSETEEEETEEEAAPEEKSDKEEESSEDLKAITESLEKAKHSAAESWKMVRTAQNKMHEVRKAVQALADSGDIEDEKAEELIGLLKIEGLKKADIIKMADEPADPCDKYLQMIDRDIVDAYKDLTGDEGLVEDHIRSFGIFWAEASPEEREMVLDDFEEASRKSKAALFKAIVKAGESFAESAPGLKEFRSSGLRAFLKKSNEEKEYLKKQIDKLQKRLDDNKSVASSASKAYFGRGTEAHSEGPTDRGNVFANFKARQEHERSFRRA